MSKAVVKCTERLDLPSKHGVSVSMEVFPPKTPTGVCNLLDKLSNLISLCDINWLDVTWGAGGSIQKSGDGVLTPLELSQVLQYLFDIPSMMHLTCSKLTKENAKIVLDQCRDTGIINILALRGERPPEHSDFDHASDLVEFINSEYGDFFCIGVAGYPETHLESVDLQSDLHWLKNKKGDIIITQLFYDSKVFVDFVDECRKFGIGLPIIPGIMPILSKANLIKISAMCGASVPEAIKSEVESLDDPNDPSRVKQFGAKHAAKTIHEFLEAKSSSAVHLYTLNQDDATIDTLQNLSRLQNKNAVASTPAASFFSINNGNRVNEMMKFGNSTVYSVVRKLWLGWRQLLETDPTTAPMAEPSPPDSSPVDKTKADQQSVLLLLEKMKNKNQLINYLPFCDGSELLNAHKMKIAEFAKSPHLIAVLKYSLLSREPADCPGMSACVFACPESMRDTLSTKWKCGSWPHQSNSAWIHRASRDSDYTMQVGEEMKSLFDKSTAENNNVSFIFSKIKAGLVSNNFIDCKTLAQFSSKCIEQFQMMDIQVSDVEFVCIMCNAVETFEILEGLIQ